MPRILSHTPAWLSRPSPGFGLFFDQPKSTKPANPADKARSADALNSGSAARDGRPHRPAGPRRVIAQRGSEVFVAVGNQIRWADLSSIKDDWEDGWAERAYDTPTKGRSANNSSRSTAASTDVETSGYRVLKVSISEPIRQLIPSPNGDIMAILTSHTVHIAKLPNPISLDDAAAGPLKMKTYTLGPTTHVLSTSPVVSALWHPLGVSGNTLVTVSAEAVVRIWELSTSNRWSFDSPTLAIDLKKLVDASSLQDDTKPANFGDSRGFSLDSVELEVAAACFGGTGAERENGWAPMTLWLAMTEGDVYALCPLLPSKWQPPSTLLPSLSVPIVSIKTALETDSDASTEAQERALQQYDWMRELDGQDPALHQPDFEWEPEIEVYDRPQNPGPIPRLQGPFQLDPSPDDNDDDLDASFTDIFAIGADLDHEQLVSGEDLDLQDSTFGDASAPGLSLGVICLLTDRGRVHVCLDLDGVQGTWLPKEKPRSRSYPKQIDYPSLLTLESIDTLRPRELSQLNSSWPVFTPDRLSPYSVFVTHNYGVSYMSFSPWVEQLENELRNDTDAGVTYRLEIFAKGVSTSRQRVLELRADRVAQPNASQPALTAGITFQDPDLGYMLLTSEDQQPHAVIFDNTPISDELAELQGSTSEALASDLVPAVSPNPPRPFYQPPASLWANSPIPDFVYRQAHGRHQRSFTEPLRLDQATLTLMGEAHKVLSDHTHHLGVAAADLFRWSERLQYEFRGQIQKAAKCAERVDDIVNVEADDYDDYDDDDDESGRRPGSSNHNRRAAIDERLVRVQEKQAELNHKYDALRKKVLRRTGRQLSDKERAWVAEVAELSSAVARANTDQQNGAGRRDDEQAEEARDVVWQRYQQAKSLAASLVAQAKELQASDIESASDGAATAAPMSRKTSAVDVPSGIRKAKVREVMKLLDRETALVEATKNRLQRLTLAEASGR